MFNAMCFAICAVLFSSNAYSTCATGYHEQTNPLDSTIYNKKMVGFMYRDPTTETDFVSYGTNYHTTNYATGIWVSAMKNPGSQLMEDTFVGGHAFCAATGSENDYHKSRTTFATSNNITTTEPGSYCWCQLYALYVYNWQYFSGTWVALNNLGSHDNCANNTCAQECANEMHNNPSFRQAIYSVPYCVADDTPHIYPINYYNVAHATWNLNQNHPYGYTTGQEITLGIPSRQNYDFVAWCDNAELTENCMFTKTIPADSVGTKSFYAKWDFANSDCQDGYKHVCLINFDVLNQNRLGYAYKPIDGSEVQTEGDKTTETYNLTQPGEWGVSFEHGDLKGISKCATTASTSDGNGHLCWCKTTDFIPSDTEDTTCHSETGLWTYSDDLVNDNHCSKYCPLSCVKKNPVTDNLFGRNSYFWEYFANENLSECVIDKYKINYVLNGGLFPNERLSYIYLNRVNDVSAPTTYQITDTVLIPRPARENFVFGGWYTEPDFSGEPIFDGFGPGEFGNITLYAKWIEKTCSEHYTLSYPANIEGHYIYSGNTWEVTFPFGVVSGTGYTSQWNKNRCVCKATSFTPKNGTTQDIVFAPEGAAGRTKNCAYYCSYDIAHDIYTRTPTFAGTVLQDPVCLPIEYTIHFESNGGTSYSDRHYNVESDNITLPEPARRGYHFDGWYENEDLSGTSVTTVSSGTPGNKTFYAKWSFVGCPAGYVAQDTDSGKICQPITYTIHFVSNSVLNFDDIPYTIESEDIELPTDISEQNGLPFVGWYEDDSFSEPAITLVPKGSTGDKIFYARWLQNTCSTVNTTANNLISLVDVETRGISTYNFNHGDWFVIFDYGKLQGRGICSNMTGDIGTKADTVTESENGSNCWCNITKFTPANGIIKEATSPWFSVGSQSDCSKTCATICGAYTFKNHNNFYTVVKPAYYLTNVCNAPVYTIHYNSNYGTEYEDQQYTAIYDTITLPTPTRAGYAFAGWYDNDNFEGEPVTQVASGSTGNKTFWAKWNFIDCSTGYIEQETNGVKTCVLVKHSITYIDEDTELDLEPSTYDITTLGTSLPSAPQGYSNFIGWCLDSSTCFSTINKIPTDWTGDKVLYLKKCPTNYKLGTPFSVDSRATKWAAKSALTGDATSASAYGLTTHGEWGATFDSGYIVGTSLCSQTPGGTRGAVGQPDETGEGDTKYCWCRVTKYGFPEREVNTTKWVAENNTTDNVSAEYCNGWCAYNCAQKAVALTSNTTRVNMATMCVPDSEYTINYVLNDENAVFPVTAIKVPHSYISSDLPISLENAIPVRPYYTFEGWYDNANFEGTAITEILSGANQDITLYAKWSWTGCQDGSYLDSSTNTCETCPDGYISNGKTATSKNDCYVEWNCSENLAGCPQNATCTYIDPDHLSGIDYYGNNTPHCEINAVCNAGYVSNNGACTEQEYPIQYIIDGGDFLGTLNQSNIPRTYTVSSVIDLSGIVASRSGYTFEGWYDNSTFEGSAIPNLSNLAPGGITLYAKFEPVVCTVIYDNEGDVSQETYSGQSVITLPVLRKNSYTFDGWCEEDLDTCPGGPKQTLTARNETVNLYAKWGDKNYTITYMDGNNTLSLLEPESYTENKLPVDLPTTAYSSNDDSVFDGWYNNPELNGDAVTEIPAGAQVTNKIFYVKWRPKYYAITYMDGDINVTASMPLIETTTSNGEDITLGELSEKNGMAFVGWCDDAQGNNCSMTKRLYANTPVILYAQREEATYHITYKNGDTDITNDVAPEFRTYTVNNPIVLPGANDVSVEHYVFNNWLDEHDTVINTLPSQTVPNGDCVLQGNFSPVQYTLSFTEDSISNMPASSVTYNIENLPNLNARTPTNPEYVFVGYKDAVSGEIISAITAENAGNIELTPEYSYVSCDTGFKTRTSNSAVWNTARNGILNNYYVTHPTANGSVSRVYKRKPTSNYTIPTAPTSGSNARAVWVTLFDQGQSNHAEIYAMGEASCNSIAGVGYETGSVMFSSSRPSNDMNNIASTGNYCWCRLTSYKPDNQIVSIQDTDWIYLKEFSSAENCASQGNEYGSQSCAAKCGEAVRTNAFFRSQIFDDLGICAVGIYDIRYRLNGGNWVQSDSINCAENEYFDDNSNECKPCANGENSSGHSNYCIPVETSMNYHAINLPQPVRTGYDFAGWCDDADLTVNCKTEKVIQTGTTNDVYVYAKWTPINYQITYNLDGGTLPSDVSNPTVYHIDDTIELPIPTKTDYIFDGWYECANYECNKVSVWGPDETDEDKQFWAKWNIGSYTITYDRHGGVFDANVADTQTYTVNDTSNNNYLTLLKPRRQGYDFVGWCLEEETPYQECGTEEIITDESTSGWSGDKKLHAKWNLEDYTITYYDNNNPMTLENTEWEDNSTVINEYNVSSKYTYPILLPKPLKSGHRFEDWYSTVNLDNDPENSTPISEIAFGTTGNKDFYAKWACAAGYYGDGTTCTICEAGTYSDTTNAANCTACLLGHTSAAGATSCVACTNTEHVTEWADALCGISQCDTGYKIESTQISAISTDENGIYMAYTMHAPEHLQNNNIGCYKDGVYNDCNDSVFDNVSKPHGWRVVFRYGTVTGTSVCSTTGSALNVANANQDIYDINTPDTTSEGGAYCWCKALDYDNQSLAGSWVFATDFSGAHATCENSCAMNCTGKVYRNSAFREVMFGNTYLNNVTLDTLTFDEPLDKAMCVPKVFPIVYHNIDEVIWNNGENHPDFYTLLQNDVTIGRPTRQGFVFMGWCETENCVDETPQNNYSFIPNDKAEGQIDLYAQWTCAAGYYKNGSACNACPQDPYGIQYTSPNENTDGINSCYYSCANVFEVFCPEHSIDCLYTGDSNATNSYGYETNNCTISFNCDPGYGVDGALCSLNTYYITYVDTLEDIASENRKTSESYTVNDLPVSKSVSPENTHTGYDFDGWCETDELTGDCLTTITIDVNTIGDKTFYARWTTQNYTITYHNNGVDSEDSYTYGTGKNLNAPETPTGYVFAGWYTNSDFSGEAVQTIADTETGSKEFWAKWTCTANYYHDSNTCTACPDLYPTSVVNDNEGIGKCYAQCETITECPEHATCSYANTIDDKDYYKENATETCVSGIECDTGYGLENGACVLQTYTVTFMDGETQLRQESYTINSVEPIVSTTPGNSGGEFAGWCDNEDLTGECSTTVTVQPSDATDKTFYAKWTCANGYYGSACTQCPEGYRNTDAGAARITDCYNIYTCPTECPPHAVSCTQPTKEFVKNYYGATEFESCDMDVVCEDGYEAKTIDKIYKNKITYEKYLNGDSYKKLDKQTFGFYASYYNTPEAITETSHLLNGETEQFFDYGSVRMVSTCDSAAYSIYNHVLTINNEPGSNCWCKFTQYSPDGINYTNLDFPWKPGLPWQTYEQCLDSCECGGVPDSWWRNQKVCSAREYTIYFETNGGYIETNNNYMLYDVTADPFDLPKPTRPGYDFAGWCNNENLTGECPITVTIQPSDAENKTFYAKWTPVVCDEDMVVATRFNTTKEPIAYSSIEIDGVVRTTEMFYPGRLPNAYGLTESGTWATEYDYGTLYGEAACKDAPYYMGDYKASPVPDEVFNTFADTPFVTIDTDDSVSATCYCKPTAFKPTFGSKQALSNNWKEHVHTSAYECNIHCAYYCSQDKSRATIHLLGEFTNTNYCAYRINYYHLNDGEFVAPALHPDHYDTGDRFTIGQPVRRGYTFAGWCVGQDRCNNTQESFEVNSSTVGAVDLYAQWTAGQYTITYNMMGGTPTYQPEQNTVGIMVYFPDDPTKEGYDFAGWCPNSETCENPIKTQTWGGATEDITMYAQWDIKTYYITYVFNNGDASVTEEQDFNEQVILRKPTKSGFTFDGYCVDTTNCNPLTLPVDSTSDSWVHSAWNRDLTLYAKWTQNVATEECTSKAWLHVGEDKACLSKTPVEKPVLVIQGKHGKYYLQATKDSNLPMNKDTTKQLRIQKANDIYNVHDETVSRNDTDNSSTGV
ncbi:MAG: InlB B-repeat-containing protein [Alphaproteobacteria bacterium]|nr:InlB B-repeat-containing protein [Alphaproteobacteria bacterium]